MSHMQWTLELGPALHPTATQCCLPNSILQLQNMKAPRIRLLKAHCNPGREHRVFKGSRLPSRFSIATSDDLGKLRRQTLIARLGRNCLGHQSQSDAFAQLILVHRRRPGARQMGLERVLTSLRPLGLGVRPLHCSAAGFADLHNSLSDGFYEVGKGGSKADVSGDRPLSRDPEVRSARLASSLGEPSYLANSLSGPRWVGQRPLQATFGTFCQVDLSACCNVLPSQAPVQA